jgi:Cu/Zn superoxide dismutase
MVLIAAIALAGCQSVEQTVQEAGTRVMGSSPGVEAPMRAVGGSSAALATVKFLDRNDGVLLMFTATNLISGTYRLALHRDPNCSSPNAFSAGPPWAPPGSKAEAGRLFPEFRTSSEGDASLTVRIPGLKTQGPDGLYGRSVVLHWGNFIDQAMPGVPNNRVLCGVVGPVLSFFN